MSKKLLKRVIAILCASVMSMSCIVTSVGAVESSDSEESSQCGDNEENLGCEDNEESSQDGNGSEDEQVSTTDKEIEFSLKYLDSLPKKGHKDFKNFLNITLGWLNPKRKCEIKHKDGKVDNFEIDEEKIYSEIKQEVEKIKKKVDSKRQEGRVRGNLLKLAKDAGFEVNSVEFSRKMLIAKEIYEWVANKISYDYESLKKDDEGNSLRKPQDALFVYEKKTGVCEGKALLTNLMMRMAEIPSVDIVTLADGNGDKHAYNAIYLEDKRNVNRTGWTLLDSTWGAPKSDLDIRGYVDEIGSSRLEQFFPVAYNDTISFRKANEDIFKNEKKSHMIEYMSLDQRDCDDDKYEFQLNDNGCVYKLCGYEGHAYVFVTGSVECIIPDDISKIGLRFKIGDMVERLVLSSDEDLDLSDADNLKEVDTKKSSRYFVDRGVLYSKYKSDNGDIVADWTTILDGQQAPAYAKEIKYVFNVDDSGTNTTEIICTASDKICDFKLAEEVKKYNAPVKIGLGIGSIILEGDDTVDLSGAKDLKEVNAQNSNKYILDNGVIYKKDVKKNDLKGDIVRILTESNGDIERGIKCKYQLNLNEKRTEILNIFVFNPFPASVRNLRLPKFLTEFNKPVGITYGVESLILEGDDIVDLSNAGDLKEIDITNSRIYKKEGDKLVEKNSNKQVTLPERVKVEIIDNK